MPRFFVGNMPELVNMQSCVFYLRQTGTPNGGTTFRDWGPKHLTLSSITGTVVNTNTGGKFSPGSIMFGPAGSSDSCDLNFSDANSYLNPSNGDFAIGAWYQGVQAHNVLFLGPTNCTGFYFLIGSSSLSGAYLSILNGGTAWTLSKPTGYSDFSSTTTPHHYAAIKKSNVLTLYLDGIPIGSGTDSVTYPSVTAWSCGVNPHSGSGYYGYMDEVGLWLGRYGVIPTISQIYKNRRLIIG